MLYLLRAVTAIAALNNHSPKTQKSDRLYHLGRGNLQQQHHLRRLTIPNPAAIRFERTAANTKTRLQRPLQQNAMQHPYHVDVPHKYPKPWAMPERPHTNGMPFPIPERRRRGSEHKTATPINTYKPPSPAKTKAALIEEARKEHGVLSMPEWNHARPRTRAIDENGKLAAIDMTGMTVTTSDHLQNLEIVSHQNWESPRVHDERLRKVTDDEMKWYLSGPGEKERQETIKAKLKDMNNRIADNELAIGRKRYLYDKGRQFKKNMARLRVQSTENAERAEGILERVVAQNRLESLTDAEVAMLRFVRKERRYIEESWKRLEHNANALDWIMDDALAGAYLKELARDPREQGYSFLVPWYDGYLSARPRATTNTL